MPEPKYFPYFKLNSVYFLKCFKRKLLASEAMYNEYASINFRWK